MGGIPTSSPSVIPTIQAMSGFAQLRGWGSIRHRRKIINASMTYANRAIMMYTSIWWLKVAQEETALFICASRDKTVSAADMTLPNLTCPALCPEVPLQEHAVNQSRIESLQIDVELVDVGGLYCSTPVVGYTAAARFASNEFVLPPLIEICHKIRAPACPHTQMLI